MTGQPRPTGVVEIGAPSWWHVSVPVTMQRVDSRTDPLVRLEPAGTLVEAVTTLWEGPEGPSGEATHCDQGSRPPVHKGRSLAYLGCDFFDLSVFFDWWYLEWCKQQPIDVSRLWLQPRTVR